jgi:hypothetical protein
MNRGAWRAFRSGLVLRSQSMPIHDWARVKAGIFHHFHHGWIDEIARTLNRGLLPPDYYALAEQYAGGFGPDVLTLQTANAGGDDGDAPGTGRRSPGGEGGVVLLAPPKARITAETEMEFYRRKQSAVTVRHISGDRVVAVVEVVSPGNKSTRHALEQFVKKAADFLDQRVHLLILDLLPPGPYDHTGVHGAIWDYIAGQAYSPPVDKPLALAAYESDLAIRAYVEPVAVGDGFPNMPLFLEPGGCVLVPLESSYQTAWDAVPSRWKRVLETGR